MTSNKTKLFISTELRIPGQNDQWAESGKFTAHLPRTLTFSPGTFMVSVNSVSMDFSPINIDSDCKITFLWNNQQNEVVCARNLCDIVQCLLSELNDKLPGDGGNKLMKLTLDDQKTRKVKLTIKPAQISDVRFSPKLANLLGFDPQISYSNATTLAERLPDMYYYFSPMILCSHTLARECFTPAGDLPILRLLNIEGKMTTEGRRVMFNYEAEKRWVPMMSHQLQEIDFYLLCCDFATAPGFLPNSGACVIELEIKRQKLSFM